MQCFLELEPGTKAAFAESLTAVSDNYFIQGYSFRIAGGGIVYCATRRDVEKVAGRLHETGVPVLDGVTAAVKMMEALVGLGLKTSKACAYDYPRAKPYSGEFAAAAPGPRPAKAAE